MLTAIKAGWALAVSVSSASGPWKMRCDSFCDSVASTRSKTWRAAGNASASALPMPDGLHRSPGNTTAVFIKKSHCAARGKTLASPALSSECPPRRGGIGARCAPHGVGKGRPSFEGPQSAATNAAQGGLRELRRARECAGRELGREDGDDRGARKGLRKLHDVLLRPGDCRAEEARWAALRQLAVPRPAARSTATARRSAAISNANG